MEERIKIALDFLKQEQSFKIGDLRLSTNGSEIIVTGWSKTLNFLNISKISSLIELQEIKDIFDSMLSISLDLKNFIDDKTIKYILCYDDAGKVSIDICYEENSIVTWMVTV